MANNIAITEGSGKTVATDEIGSIHYQLVKLVTGEEGQEARIHGDATNGLFTQVKTIAAGDNNIGNVDIVTQPARIRTTDSISVAMATDVIMNNLTALTPKFAVIDTASSGDTTIVSAVTSKKIRVLSVLLVAAGTVNVRFESNAAGTALTGQMNMVANTGFCLPYNPVGWFETASGQLLNLELSASQSVDGMLTYIEV